MKQKILRFLRKLFKVHSPHDEWMDIYKKPQPKKQPKFGFTRHEVQLLMAVGLILLFIAISLFALFVVTQSNTTKAEEKEPEIIVDQPVVGDKVEVEEESEPEPVEVKAVAYFDVPLNEDLQDRIFQECETRDVDPAIIVAMIQKESYFNPNCISDGGASHGLMQIQPRWHQPRADKLGCSDLMNPYHNVTVGIDLFSSLLKQKGSLEWALMAYNGGPSYANRKTNNGEVSSYARSVIDISKKLERV